MSKDEFDLMSQDTADLYDWELRAITAALGEIQKKYLWKNLPANMESIAEECEEALLKIGFIAKVGIKYYMHGSQLIGCPDVISVHRATVLEFDHERKQFEVLDANAKGEAYRGQIEKVDKGS